ncbi:MAG: acetylglutamate/LysW-gamma-L-alpha-aminoadipate kinase [Gammaproteobacteria bacterium]|jgi:acetylglutamate/LysW-gamma-L-alpha-aminoadipate kinase
MILVKIGGGESLNIDAVIKDLAQLDDDVLIVHGANVLRDQIAKKLGFEKKVLTSASGYSSVYSDQDALDVIMMSYSGLRNKQIVQLCQQNNINAVGLTGLDGRLVQGERNKGIRVRENGKTMIKRDLSGKPRSINVDLLNLLMSNGYCPVLTIPIIDEKGFAINSENDDIVALIANALEVDTVVQLIEAPGFMDNPDAPDSLVRSMSVSELTRRESEVEGRIKRKLLALTKLCQGGKTHVIIADGRTETPVTDALNGAGTHIA